MHVVYVTYYYGVFFFGYVFTAVVIKAILFHKFGKNPPVSDERENYNTATILNMMNFLPIHFFLKIVAAGEIYESINFDQNYDSARTVNLYETSTVIFLTSYPIIDIINAAVNESEVIKQLEFSFETEFVENILSSLDGEMIDLFEERLFLDRIMIIAVLNASNITIGYYSVKGSTDY